MRSLDGISTVFLHLLVPTATSPSADQVRDQDNDNKTRQGSTHGDGHNAIGLIILGAFCSFYKNGR